MFSPAKTYEPIKLYANLEIITDVEALGRSGLAANVDLPKARPEPTPAYYRQAFPRLDRTVRKHAVPVSVANVGAVPYARAAWVRREVNVPRPSHAVRPDVLAGVTPRVPKNWYSRYRPDLRGRETARVAPAYPPYARATNTLHVTNVELPALGQTAGAARPPPRPLKRTTAATATTASASAGGRRLDEYWDLCRSEQTLYKELHGRLADFRRRSDARSTRTRLDADLIGENVDEIVAVESIAEMFRAESNRAPARTNTPKDGAFVDVAAEQAPDRCEKVHEWFGRSARTPDDADDDLYARNADAVKKRRSHAPAARDYGPERKLLQEKQSRRASKTERYVHLLKTISKRIDRLNDTLAVEQAEARARVETSVAALPTVKVRKSAVRFRTVEQVLSSVGKGAPADRDDAEAVVGETRPETKKRDDSGIGEDTGYATTDVVRACDCPDPDKPRRVESETQTRAGAEKGAPARVVPEKSSQTEPDGAEDKLTPRSQELLRNDFKGGVPAEPKRVICDCKECFVDARTKAGQGQKDRPDGDIDTQYLQSRAQALHERLSGTLQELYDTIMKSEYLKKELGSFDLSPSRFDVETFIGAFEERSFGIEGSVVERYGGRDDTDTRFDETSGPKFRGTIGVSDSIVEEVERTIDYQEYTADVKYVSFLNETDAVSNTTVVLSRATAGDAEPERKNDAEPERKSDAEPTRKGDVESEYFSRIDSMKRTGEIPAGPAEDGLTSPPKKTVKKCTKCRCAPKEKRPPAPKCACGP